MFFCFLGIFILGTYQALFVFHMDCALDLGVVSTADLVKCAYGDMKDDNEFVIKTTLQFVNLLTNICKIQKDATESALHYLFTNNSNNNYQGLNNVTK